MWISYSPDLRHWGRHRLMLEARRGAWWDANKIGLSPPPIETSRGWLVLYHGVRHTPSGCLYRLGLALFDLENPEKCLLRGDSWIFGPEAEYERHGDVDDVVQAGARPMTSLQYLLELQRDWARSETYVETTGIARVHGGAYGLGVIYAKTMFAASEGH